MDWQERLVLQDCKDLKVSKEFMGVLACRAFKGHQVFKDLKDHLESPEFKVNLDYFPKFKLFPFFETIFGLFSGRDGADGKDGRDGIEGKDGKDGQDGAPGPPG